MRCLLVGVITSILAFDAARAELLIKPDDTIAIVGDSITEQKQYSVFIEDYFLMCHPVPNVKILQFGWGGENLGHLNDRLANVLRFSPTVATVCYGANDGGYHPADDATEATFHDETTKLLKALKAGGVRHVILGTPTVADRDCFALRKTAATAEQYNEVFRRFGAIDKTIADSEGAVYADVHGNMMNVMNQAKAKYGKDYAICEDGIHPGANGHLVLAYTFLKAMGFDGAIGTITYDATTGHTDATEGQQVTSSKVGEISLVSTRYPFCFFNGAKDTKDTDATLFNTTYYIQLNRQDTFSFGDANVLQFFPFNQDLNRYLLVVKNLKTPRAKITWGTETKEFTADQLQKGINLAAEFLNNPFVEPFKAVDKAVRDKQAFETIYIKQYLDGESVLYKSLPGRAAAVKNITASFESLHHDLAANCAKAVQPVAHVIKIDPVP